MRRLSCFLKPDPQTGRENINYIRSQLELLSDKEEIVTLKMDEVSLSPALEFQGEQVFGYAENNKMPKLTNNC